MAAVSDILLPKNFDVTRMTFGQPKQLENGGKTVYISYNDRNLLVQTPEMSAPFGVSVWPGERGAPDKYNVDMSFSGKESRPPLQTFFSMLEQISDRVITAAMENSQSWFKRREFPSRDVVEALYTPIIRFSKDRDTGEINNQYPPNFKLSLPFREGKFQFPAYDNNRAEVDMLALIASNTRGKGSRVSAIAQCTGVWLAGGKFGVTWKVKQLRIIAPQSLPAFAFQRTEEDGDLVEDDVDNEDVPASASVPAPAPTTKKAAGTANKAAAGALDRLIASSDEEEEGPDALEP